MNENVRISIEISLKFVPKGPINNIPTLVQIMAWRQPGGKPLSEPMMVRLSAHIWVTLSQWGNRSDMDAIIPGYKILLNSIYRIICWGSYWIILVAWKFVGSHLSRRWELILGIDAILLEHSGYRHTPCWLYSTRMPQESRNAAFISWYSQLSNMMTSSNGNIFRVTGPLCGNSPVTGEFPAQRPVTRSFEVFFELRLNKRLSKQSWGWWFEKSSHLSWRHSNE